MKNTSITEDFASYIYNLTFDSFPEATISKAKFAIIDLIGCIAGGSQTDIGKIVIDATWKLSGGKPEDGGAPVLGTDLYMSYGDAAFCNTFLSNIMDYDDTGATGHPGSTVLGAALSAAAYRKNQGDIINGKEFIVAVISGYQAAMRVSKYLYPTWERYKEIHGIGSSQIFGAAAAAGKILHLTEEEFQNLFGTAGAFACVAHAGKFGWEEHRLSWIKDNVARPAEGGVRAAFLCKEGFVGNQTMLDGDRGFWIMAGSDQYCMNLLTENRNHFDIDDLSFKPYPCCRWIHTTLDALQKILDRQSISPEDISEIHVYSIEALASSFTDKTPHTMLDAEFSIPYCISAAVHQIPFPLWNRKETLNQPNILQLSAKIKVHCDSSSQEEYLQKGRLAWWIPSRVEIIFKDGSKTEASDAMALGCPLKSMTESQLNLKYQRLTGNQACYAAVKEKIDHLESFSVNEILECLKRISHDR